MRDNIGNIKIVSENVGKRLSYYGIDDKTIRNSLLALEELLLLYKEKLQNDDTPIKIVVFKGIRKLSLKIEVLAEEFSPDALQSSSDYKYFNTIIKKSGFSTDYSYTGKINKIEIVVKRYFGAINNFLLSFKYIQKKSVLFGAFFAHVISTIANIVIPIFTGRLIIAYTDNILIQVITTATALLLMRLIYSVSLNIANIFYVKSTYLSEAALRSKLIEKMFFIKNADYENVGTGTFIQRATTDLRIISNGMTSILDIFSESVYYIGVLFATALINIWVFLAELITIVILLLLELARAYRLGIDRRKTNLSDDKLSSSIVDCINGVPEIKLLNAREIFTKKVSIISNIHANNAHVANRNTRRWIIASSCVVAVLVFLIMVFLGYNLQKGLITVPVALILFNYFTIIDRPVVLLIQRAIDFIKQFDLATERVRNIFDESEFNYENYGELHVEKLYGDIVFDDVTFAYNHDDLAVDDNDILENTSFNIKRGETVAFVGRSGSGKSTVLKILSNQVACYSGCVTIDGYNILDLDSDSLYNNISVISQSTILFNSSIKENLLLAKPEATMEELEDVCEKACIIDDIKRTENGFDTILGEGGVRFSGGQRQRLAIARALLRGTDILLLDEATSAMDNVTQDHIIKTIDNISEGRTIIIVAHRLSTIKNADRIMLVEGKKILASGTHEELMNTSEEYRSLYQFENEKQ